MDERLLELRELMMNAPNPAATRAVALVIGIGVLVTVMGLVRARRLQAEYTPIWIALAVATCAVGVHLPLLRGVADWIGAWTLSSTIFFLGLLALGGICLHYAVKLSRAGLQIKTLAQEVALLRYQVEQIEERSAS
jgi:hypothetical protein